MSFKAGISTLIIASLTSTHALGLRCGTRVISTGDSKPQVWEKCGEPQFTEVIRDTTRWGDYLREERWYYPKRSGRLRPVVIFNHDGKVSEIRSER